MRTSRSSITTPTVHAPVTTTRRSTAMAWLAALLVVALVAAACGSDGTTVAAGPEDDGDGDAVTTPENPDSSSRDDAVGGSSVDYVGLDIDGAQDLATDQGRPWRVVVADGVELAGTRDYVEQRVNLEVADGVVVVAYFDHEQPDRRPGKTLAGEQSDDADEYVGLTVDEAGDRADAEGRAWRVVKEDGEDLIVTMDYNPDRLNFEVEDDVVTAAYTDSKAAEN